jgi:flagellar hook-length control protein FliK
LGTLPQSVDKIATNNYAPKWRPIDQLVEHEIVKQVADKLSIQRLNVKSGDGVTIELEPKELGALKIEISIHKNLVSADILTQHASVRDILDKNQSLLRDAMTQMGFNVDKFSVNVGDFNQLQQHFSRRESFNKQSGTDFAFNNREGNSAESLFDRAGSGSKYWGHVESRVSVYV